MPTKFRHRYTKELNDTHWSWIITVEVGDTPSEKRKFLEWMTAELGEQGTRWGIRWIMLCCMPLCHECTCVIECMVASMHVCVCARGYLRGHAVLHASEP